MSGTPAIRSRRAWVFGLAGVLLLGAALLFAFNANRDPGPVEIAQSDIPYDGPPLPAMDRIPLELPDIAVAEPPEAESPEAGPEPEVVAPASTPPPVVDPPEPEPDPIAEDEPVAAPEKIVAISRPPEPEPEPVADPEAPAAEPAPTPAPTRKPPPDLNAIRNAYLQAFHRQIEKYKQYPPQSKRLRRTGRVSLLIGIDAQGTLELLEVVESSGHLALDEAALQAVRDAAPFPPPPIEAFDAHPKFRLGLEFSLR